MAAKYWIKLYIEILHDRKMAKMSDRLFKQTILLFLLAGETNKDGQLPPLEDIAWALRIDEDECNDSLQKLQRLGVAHCNDNATWCITHFEERQRASTSTERSRALRQRNTREKLNNSLKNDATNTQRNVAPDTESDTDRDREETVKPSTHKRPGVVPAVKIHVEITGKYSLNKTQIQTLKETVGDGQADLERWRNVVNAWVLAGYKVQNISGMLDWFKNGIPTYKNKTENGTGPPANKSSPPPQIDMAAYEKLRQQDEQEVYNPLGP